MNADYQQLMMLLLLSTDFHLIKRKWNSDAKLVAAKKRRVNQEGWPRPVQEYCWSHYNDDPTSWMQNTVQRKCIPAWVIIIKIYYAKLTYNHIIVYIYVYSSRRVWIKGIWGFTKYNLSSFKSATC